MNISNKLLPTTVVGSYPVVKNLGFRSLIDPLQSAVENAVSDQIEVGIDIISDGQVRGDMIRAFTTKLPGIRDQVTIGKILPSPLPITIADTKYALSRFPQVKGIITGPTTLAHALKIGTPMYRDRQELCLDLAQALVIEAKALESIGVAILQIDEPIFSTGIADMDSGRKAIEGITSSLKVPICLHVCGELIDVIDDILKIQVAVYDFEFSTSQANLEIISEKDVKDKIIGFGCIDTTNPSIESVPIIEKRIESGIEVFSIENLLIDPDCGMRMLPRNSAFYKLRNMVEATRSIRIKYS